MTKSEKKNKKVQKYKILLHHLEPSVLMPLNVERPNVIIKKKKQKIKKDKKKREK